jgi:hypothetical protein
MNTLTRYILPLILLSLVLGCRKEDPGTHHNYEEEVVFYVRGNMAGMPFEFKAGQQDYVMASEFIFQDSVVEMRGSLLPHGSLHQEGLAVRLRGRQRLSGISAFDASQNINTGALALRDATGFRKETGKYIVSLSCDSTNGQYASHIWHFPDGSFSNAYYVEKKVDLDDYPVYPVRLETSGAFSCQSEVYHEINLQGECDAGFDLDILANFTAQVSLKNIQGNVDSVAWYLNGARVSPDPLDHTIYLGNTGSDHLLRCEVYFTDDCVKVMERKVGSNFADNCMTDFHYQARKEVVFDPSQLATAEIIYYDDTGKKFTSYYPDAQGEFEVISFSPYMHNENGDPTLRIHFQSNAILKSADGSTLELSNVQGSFAIAHP